MSKFEIIVNVSIRGPGGVISIEAEMIKQALTEMGCEVEVNDPYPSDAYYIVNTPVSVEELVHDIREKKRRKTKIIIDLHHLPWGG